MTDDKVGHLVIVDVIENEDGGATYKFDLDDKVREASSRAWLTSHPDLCSIRHGH
jgi:hypothetical protein